MPLFLCELIRGAIHRPFMICFGKLNLFSREILLSSNRRPRRRGVTAFDKLVVFSGMALATVFRGEPFSDGEPVVCLLFLSF